MDYVSDLLSRMQVSILRKKLYVKVLKNKNVIRILWCLYKEGFIRGFSIKEKNIIIFLKYKNGISVIKKFKRVSKGSKKVYSSVKALNRKLVGARLAIISGDTGIFTSMSIMNSEVNKKSQLSKGGEILFYIY